jgi:alcohol-forming fatty acyl-CoA reductase
MMMMMVFIIQRGFQVEFIFHGAATVRFDEPLKTAVEINVRGTREIFQLARQCGKLKAVVHISTAYR